MSTPTAPRSRYSMGSAQNLVLSLLAVLGMVAVLVLLVPRVNSVSGPPVDIHATAVDVAKRSGWPVLEAVGLPEGWTATSARYVRTTDGFMTWHAGYQTPAGTYVAVEQTKDPSRAWVDAQTNRAPREGTLEAAGLTWTKFVRDTKVQNSLLNEPTDPGALTTLLTGTASFEEMAELATHLEPVTP
ncbi:DUF4245 domain-containing protein [Oryzobacter sp. R7]|uniref:DUF4245 domain-containing protein n=1 Tax=Oryzobacter faecalis TaxID=3388656 RepID=UPI00398CA663